MLGWIKGIFTAEFQEELQEAVRSAVLLLLILGGELGFSQLVRFVVRLDGVDSSFVRGVLHRADIATALGVLFVFVIHFAVEVILFLRLQRRRLRR